MNYKFINNNVRNLLNLKIWIRAHKIIMEYGFLNYSYNFKEAPVNFKCKRKRE